MAWLALNQDLWFHYVVERKIDGNAFISLSREDFAIIYPSNEKFLLGSSLYKLSLKGRMPDRGRDTQSLLDEMSDLEDYNFPSRVSTPCSSHSSSSESRKRATPSRIMREGSSGESQCSNSNVVSDHFRLPVFSPDIKRCVQKDAFYTSAQRNRLIKESCLALRGYCWERDKSVTNEDKRSLAKSLMELSPKSLGDMGTTSSPEVSFITQDCLFIIAVVHYRLDYMVKLFAGFKTTTT